ncbi:hypothetical protein DITRI_Ditri12bG0085600 [Diplodiscus trichospermus]
MAINNEDWPADMVIEILLRLPVKSIIRFKCVVKSWSDLFRNPSFVSQQHSISKKHKRLLLYQLDADTRDLVMRLSVDETLVSYQNFSHQLPSPFDKTYFIDYFVDNGLFCLSDRKDFRITLWNPATREIRNLPACSDPNIPPKVFTEIRILGFGLDPLSNDYKVIYFEKYIDLETNWQATSFYAVYRMSTDSWRVLKEEEYNFFSGLFISHYSCNVCINGVYYWQEFKIGYPGRNHTSCKVLAFDLNTEVFKVIECPLSEGTLFPFHDDRLSFWGTTKIMEGRRTSNEVWVWNDEGHWTKLFKIEPLFQVERTLGFWKNSKVFVQSVKGQLLLCDLQTQEFKVLAIKNRKFRYLLQLNTYEECLVPIRKD